jgi:hypothetical protein
MTNKAAEIPLDQRLHSETALIDWCDLQRNFAQGNVLLVSNGLNLVNVAKYFAQDDAQQIADLLERDMVSQPSNEQARSWHESKAELWAVVVAPFVLVQPPQ